MQSLQLTAQIAADGMLHVPVPDFAGQEVEVFVLLTPKATQPTKTLIGQDALNMAQAIGFIGSLDAEPEFSTRYKDELDWSVKT